MSVTTAIRIIYGFVLFAACGVAQAGEVVSVPTLDLERYAGQWYEIARLPNKFQKDCTGNVTATYTLREDGRIDVVNRCEMKDGKVKAAEGVARRVSDTSNSQLEVRFAPAFLSFISAVWGDYWIIDLAADYSYAVIGEPRRRYLWILSRSRQLAEATLNGIHDRIRAQGYDPAELVPTPQRSILDPA